MIKKILFVVFALIIVLVIVIAAQPADFSVSRSATLPHPASAVFAQVNDLHKWQAWSPWAKLDPNAKMTYEGPESGVGAACTWDGNSQVGAGKMTIAESKPDELVRFNMEFLKPFKAESTAEFTFKPEGDNTVVTWTMYGKNGFIGKAIHLCMDCDKMVGGEFEKGLENLKGVLAAQKSE